MTSVNAELFHREQDQQSGERCPHGVLLAEIDEHWTACEECAADAGAEIAEQSIGH